jgi:hypothetical protein
MQKILSYFTFPKIQLRKHIQARTDSPVGMGTVHVVWFKLCGAAKPTWSSLVPNRLEPTQTV